MPGESEGEDTDTGEYESDIGSDEIEWNETEETFQFE
jgi:hypothetical protein